MKKLYLYVTFCFLSHYIAPKTIETFDEFITEIQSIDENLENLVDINAYIR